MVMNFQPLTMTFLHVSYFFDTPKDIIVEDPTKDPYPDALVAHVSGIFSPGVLTALMGCSGAGKTTLLDVLAGRKTSGKVQGYIRISGHPKEQKTFARICGYVEQKCNDIHSSRMTIYESLWFSASLRHPNDVHQTMIQVFIEEAMQLVELDSLRNVLVGDLSRGQLIRLSIAVELVANPSIIFMDEPTTGLAAHDAAIVMRTVRNAVNSGRTVVCSLHQPTIQIFEVFDEILLLNHRGRVIYGGTGVLDVFIEEAMQLVELDSLRNVLVGDLSRGQLIRLSIAVELVANPSIIFMDEPTTGLAAHDAAIVMRTVRNAVNSGRTVVCSLHQPTIQIFEVFDEILLLNHRGRVIYGGKLGDQSQTMIRYFQGVFGSPIPKGYNPATWVVEMTTPANKENIDRRLEREYRDTQHFSDLHASIKKLMIPPRDSMPLKFDSQYSENVISQFILCIWKKNLVYQRNHMLNVVRLLFSTVSAIILGTVFMDAGSKRDSTQHVNAAVGALYGSTMFIGMYNFYFCQLIFSTERKVFYREKAAGMYSPIVYALALGLVEIPYALVQTILYGYITIQFERTPGKFMMYLVSVFLTSSYSTLCGMIVVGLTATQHLAAIVFLAIYSLWNLFSGLLIQQPSIGGWWEWMYYTSPVQWTLRGMVTSQLGNVETTLDGTTGFNCTVKEYIRHLNYDSDTPGDSIAVLGGFCILFLCLFGFSLKHLSFQRR